jgi:hypothetical protein
MATSALSPFRSQLRTLVSAARRSHFCHWATFAPSFNHLVGAREQRGRHGEPEHPCGPKVDDELEFGRQLNRQVGGLLALEDAIHIRGRQPKDFDTVDSVGD